LGVDKGILEKSGTWISYGGERMGQGRENARVFLKEHKDVREKIEAALRKKMEIPSPGGEATVSSGSNGVSQNEKHVATAAAATAAKARPAAPRN
jgi:recombination protein RecA